MPAEYIEQREESYFVRGSRVSLDSVVYGFLEGASPETIRDDFPSLSLEQVYGAITFYLAHRPRIDAYLQAGKSQFERARRSQAHVSEELRARIGQAREQLDPRR
jgi:uncharacterized protein (DUF433 family)